MNRTIAICICVLCFFSVTVYAESIFLKDGRILEGEILKENDRGMEVKLKDGTKVNVARKEILRTVVSDSYKTRMYIMRADKSVLPVYIVDEDNESYTCRLELSNAEEFHIKKSDVIMLSKVPPQSIVEEEKAKKESEKPQVKTYTWKEKVTWRAPLLRFGYGVYNNINDQLEYLYPDFDALLFIDFFPWRFRGKSGSGFDIMIRAKVFGYKAGDHIPSTDERTPEFEKLFNITIVTDYDGGDFYINTIGAGIRYAYNFYWFGIAFQPYVFVLGNINKYSAVISTNNSDYESEGTGYGYQCGIGMDISLLPYVGVFVEYAYGYSPLEFPNGDKYNADGHFVSIGASYRTSYGLIE